MKTAKAALSRSRNGTPSVLYVSLNHPDVRPGGAEAYALDLHRAVLQRGQFASTLLAKGGPPISKSGSPHHGTRFEPIDENASEYFVYTDGYEFDWFLGTITDKTFYNHDIAGFLAAIQPDLVHFQHTQFLGYEMLRQVRKSLPTAPIVYTLHEFLPICHNDG